jgi:hypothetical protein
MSYDIEYTRAVLVDQTFTPDPSWHDYYVFHKIGCNNVSPRPKDWHLMTYGKSYAVMQKVCTLAGDTEGGMLKYSNGNTTPENYIHNYREALKKAHPLTLESLTGIIGIYELHYVFYVKTLYARLNAMRESDKGRMSCEGKNLPYTLKAIQKLFADASWSREVRRSFDDVQISLSRRLVSLDDFKAWVNNRSLVQKLGGYAEFRSVNNK